MTRMPNIGLLLVRVAMASVFLHSASFKFLRMGYRNFVTNSAGTIPSYMPHALGVAYLHVVPFAELIVGILLLIGLATRISAAIMAAMLVSFMIAVTGFLDHGGPHSSLIYAVVCIAIALMGPGLFAIDGLRLRKLVTG